MKVRVNFIFALCFVFLVPLYFTDVAWGEVLVAEVALIVNVLILLRWAGCRYAEASTKFEPRDLWVGVYWEVKTLHELYVDVLYAYVCIVPMFPIVFKTYFLVKDSK